MTLWLFLAALFMAAGAFLIFLWGLRTGQFRDLERVKRRVLDAEGIKEEQSEREEGRGDSP